MAKSKIITLIDHIADIAKREKWTKAYDKELDYFCWTNQKESRNARLVKISNEVLIYFNLKGFIKGIGVEYLRNNFIEHNPKYKDLPKLFTQKVDEGIFVVPENKEKEKKVADKFNDFTKELVKEIKIESWDNKQSPEALEKLINVAISN